MKPFTYNSLPARVIFGSGTIAALGEEIKRLGCSRALILSTLQQQADAQALGDRIGPLAAGLYANATMHTPVAVTEEALAVARNLNADVTVALGGGSTTGLGKAIALRTDLPQIVIPTTYAGSEATPILGETRDGLKTTQRSLKVLPEVILYDVDLTLSLPPGLSATSGMNAIAHAVEALYAQDANPITSLMAQEAIRALAIALPVIVKDPANKEARSDALYGAWLCGICLGTVGMALHHKLCHTLGGTFDLPHAETHTVVLPHAAAYNAPATPAAMESLARALNTDDPVRGLYDLERKLGTPMSLQDLGMPQAGLDKAADLALANPYWNPRPLERSTIRALLDDAWAGRPPSSR
jgi:alcohol dehydrogenase class IV